MNNILDDYTPKIIKNVYILAKESKSSNFFSKKRWRSAYEICRILLPEKKYNEIDGRTKEIVNDFEKSGIIKKDSQGYYFDRKHAKKLYKDTVYSKCGKELGLGDDFA